MSKSVFEITIQKGFNNTGKLKRNADGYLEIVLSAVEFPNSYGAVYDKQSAVDLLNASGAFQRRISQGYIYGELGHPVERECRSYADYVNRIHTIDPRNVAIHIRKVWVNPNYKTPDGRTICAIMGEIKEAGPHAEQIKAILDDPSQNLAVSVRSMTEDKIQAGVLRKYYRTIVTWDVVIEPGIAVANQFNSPSCEQFVVEQVPVNTALISRMVQEQQARGVSMESAMVETMQTLRKARQLELRNGGLSIADMAQR